MTKSAGAEKVQGQEGLTHILQHVICLRPAAPGNLVRVVKVSFFFLVEINSVLDHDGATGSCQLG